MGLRLTWMRADAPYMPIVSQGLLEVIAPHDATVTAQWIGRAGTGVLNLDTKLDAAAIAEVVAASPLPDPTVPSWPTTKPQALGPSLRGAADPLGTYHELVEQAGPVERRLLHGIATDQVVDSERVPERTRLLRGAKSDLSAFSPLRKTTTDALQEELLDGPDFRPGKSGTALGLVPEVQTFGGSTGPKPSDIGAESALLSRLLRHGILALPPTGVLRRGRRVVGGPLIAEDGALSWPRWTVPCGPRDLRAMFALAAVHVLDPDPSTLKERGIDAVFRSTPQQLSTTVAVFRWGRRVV